MTRTRVCVGSLLQEIIASVPARQAMLAQKKQEEAAKAAAGYVHVMEYALVLCVHGCG